MRTRKCARGLDRAAAGGTRIRPARPRAVQPSDRHDAAKALRYWSVTERTLTVSPSSVPITVARR